MSSSPKLSEALAFLAAPAGGLSIAAADSATGNNVGQAIEQMADPQMPQAPKLPDLPDPNDPDVLRRQDEEALKERKRAGSGRASTILTGGTGLLGSPSVSRRVLLGS